MTREKGVTTDAPRYGHLFRHESGKIYAIRVRDSVRKVCVFEYQDQEPKDSQAFEHLLGERIGSVYTGDWDDLPDVDRVAWIEQIHEDRYGSSANKNVIDYLVAVARRRSSAA